MTIIIGAGLAGLSAGYELAKSGEPVTIIETSDYPGGRVHSFDADGHMIDLGGFITYPWYTEFHRMSTELGINDQLAPMKQHPIYYELEPDVYTKDANLSFPVLDIAKIYSAATPKLFFHKSTIDAPALHTFNDTSISEYIRSVLKTDEPGKYETFADIICQGYCYAPADEYKTAIVAPISYNLLFHGNLKKSASYEGNTSKFPKALAAKIIELGGEIRYNETVTDISANTVVTDKRTYTADNIIYAGRYDSSVLASRLPDETTHCHYTNFYNCVIEFDAPPVVDNGAAWGAIFYLPREDMKYQVLSSVNVQAIADETIHPNQINFNVIARTDGHEDISDEALLKEITPDLARIFPGVTPNRVVVNAHWDHAMPIATENAIASVRNIQGKDAIWYAGDFLGAPSMETALRTGLSAAKAVIMNSESQA